RQGERRALRGPAPARRAAARAREPREVPALRRGGPRREGVQPVRPGARPEIGAQGERAGGLPPGSLEEPDDGRRDGGEIPRPGGKAPAARAARCPSETALGARDSAEGRGARRDDESLT